MKLDQSLFFKIVLMKKRVVVIYQQSNTVNFE